VEEAALPHPKPGLWRWTSHMAGGKQVCLSGQLLSAFASRPGCPVVSRVRTEDGAYVVKIACKDGPVSGSYARAQGDFTTSFQVDLQLGDVGDHVDARYLGPCPAGRQPDDQPAP
jgi:hypothetical protein